MKSTSIEQPFTSVFQSGRHARGNELGCCGLVEIENDGYGATSAIQDLVKGLNDATASNTVNADLELIPFRSFMPI